MVNTTRTWYRRSISLVTGWSVSLTAKCRRGSQIAALLNVDTVQSQTQGMNAALARFAEMDDDKEESSFRKLSFKEFSEWFLRAAGSVVRGGDRSPRAPPAQLSPNCNAVLVCLLHGLSKATTTTPNAQQAATSRACWISDLELALRRRRAAV